MKSEFTRIRLGTQTSLASVSGLVLTLGLAALSAPPACAQPSGGATQSDAQGTGTSAVPAGLEEVTITARYQKEEAQTVPISLSALSTADLQERGYRSVVEAAQAMPNVMLTPTGQQEGNAVGVTIRGVGQTDSALTLQPGVGVYIDGVYQATLFGAEYGLLDIASLQVLRGPQGTLFGRNSEGGAIEINSVQPNANDSGYAELGYGNYSHHIVRGAYDFSLVPNRVALRISAGEDQYDGYSTRLDYGCLHPGSPVVAQTAAPGCVLGREGGDDARSLRAILHATLTDNLQVTLEGNGFNDDAQPPANTTVAIKTALPNGIPTLAGLLGLTHPGLNYGSGFVTNSAYLNYDTFGDPLTGDPFSGRSYPPQNDLTASGASGTLDWRINDDLSLKSITAFQQYRGAFTSANTAPYGSYTYQVLTHRQFTQELHLNGEALHDTLDWTVGAFLLSARSKDRGENALTALNNDFSQDEPATDANRSLFAHLNDHLTRQLSLELGGRYSHDEESYAFNRIYLAPFFGSPAGSPVVTPKRYGTSSSRWDYRAALDEQWTGNVMSYVSVATGYKAGGINPRVLSDATVTTFQPEELTSYETGLKSDWLDHRLRVNADAFFSDYRNLQLNTTQAVPNGFEVVYENVGVVHIYGFETELQARPTAAFSLYANVGWLHYHALELGGAAYDPVYNTGGITPGAPPPDTPSWKGGAGGEYRIRLGGGRGTVSVRADESYQSRLYFDNQGTAISSQAAYGVLNLALAWRSAEDAWLATLRVDNALDKQYWVSMNNLINPLGILSAEPSRPRMITVTVRRNFE